MVHSSLTDFFVKNRMRFFVSIRTHVFIWFSVKPRKWYTNKKPWECIIDNSEKKRRGYRHLGSYRCSVSATIFSNSYKCEWMTVFTYRFSLHRPWDNREHKRYLWTPAIFPFNTGPRKHMWGHCGPLRNIILALPVAYAQWTSKLACPTGHCHCTALQIKRETHTLFLKLHC